MKNKNKSTVQPAAPRLETMRPADADALRQQADDWTDRSMAGADRPACTLPRRVAQLPLSGRRLRRLPAARRTVERHPFRKIALDGAALNRVEFVGCKLLGAALPDATLNHVRLERCSGRYLNLSGSRLRQVQFEECDLTEAAFNDCSFDGVAFGGSTLRSTEFSHTSLRGVDLRQSQLSDLRLNIDDLRGAVVAPMQALDLLPLLGVVVRTPTAEESQ